MRKDIFIDNNIAKNFCNPLDPEYKKLVQWLLAFTVDAPAKNAYLMVSQKLLSEYNRTMGGNRNIAAIIDKMTREGRLVKISNEAIKEFQRKYFTKKVEKKLTCNYEDREYIPIVLLSERKYALCRDKQFVDNLVNFPGFVVKAARRPQDLPYDG